jgi:general secretion pathway protein K
LKKRSNGFALAAALWLLAGLAIVVSLVNDTAITSAERVRQLRERSEFVRSSLASRAYMLYFVAQARPLPSGYVQGDLMLLADETPYRFDPLSVLRIQDFGGLISLNKTNRTIQERFLLACGIPSDQTPSLMDALEDYIDADDLQRVSGAERDTYALNGKIGPRNAPLLSVDEIWQVHGWARHKRLLTANGCNRALTVSSTASSSSRPPNMATAPLMVLRGIGVDEATAMDIVKARGDSQRVAERVVQATEQTGNATMFNLSVGVVQRELRVTHEHSNLPWVMEYTLKLDFENDEKPWSIAQPVIGARTHTPIASSASAVEWPIRSAPTPPTTDANRVLSF